MELIGKYIISLPVVASDYYVQIAERIAVRVSALGSSLFLCLLLGHKSWREEACYQIAQKHICCGTCSQAEDRYMREAGVTYA